MPTSLPPSMTKAFGEWLMTISTFSASASSSSHSEALKKARGLRAMTLTFFAPRRSELRQQSIAVLPTPMISTFSPIARCGRRPPTRASRCRCGCGRVSLRPGRFSSLPLGAPEPTNTASKPPLSSSLRMLSTGVPVFSVDAHVEDEADLLVQHRLRQAERRDVAAHEAAGHGEALEDRHVIAQRREIVGHGQRGRAGADAGDALAVLHGRRLRQLAVQLALEVGGDALEAADRHRLLLDAAAPAGRLAGPVADAAEDAREHVGIAVQQVRVGEAPLRDEADVFGHIGVRGTGPLAIDDLVEIVRMRSVGRFHVTFFYVAIAPV